MKKLTVLFLAMLLSGGLFAQMPNFGIKAGATASSLNTSDLSANYNSDNLWGYQLGAFMRLNAGKLYVQPEVVYNHRSTQLFEEASMQEVTFKVGTIDVPLLLGFKVLDAKVFNLRAFVGPEVSFATDNQEINYPTGMKSSAISIGEYDFNKTSWYMQAGVGVDLLFLTFDIRYEKGLNDFINDYQNDGSFKNNVWVFSLGLKFM